MAIIESFVSLVGLIGQYRSEKSGKETKDLDEFMIWLAESNHEDLMNMLRINTQATTCIKAILNQDREKLDENLKKLDGALLAFSKSIEGFSNLASSIHPEAVLSDQAMSILKQFNGSGASKALELQTYGGTQFPYLDANGELEFSDKRFMEDDVCNLIELNLLRLEHNSSGKRMLVFTRQAASLCSE